MFRFKRGKHCIYNVSYHIIWTPKYRKCILKDNIKIIIENALLEKSEKLNISMEKYEIMPDHVHIFLKCNPTQNIANIIGQLKDN